MSMTVELVDHGRMKRAIVSRSRFGWRYQEQTDQDIVRDVTFRHWHRVELALRTFEWRLTEADQSTNR